MKLLLQEGQEHLLGHWQPGKDDDQKIRFLDQVILGCQLPLKLLFFYFISSLHLLHILDPGYYSKF